jgi:hypothetical protein
VRLLASRPTPNLEDQGIPLRLAHTPRPVRHGCPTSSYATALRVSGALKPHHHDKVETPSVGICIYKTAKRPSVCLSIPPCPAPQKKKVSSWRLVETKVVRLG